MQGDDGLKRRQERILDNILELLEEADREGQEVERSVAQIENLKQDLQLVESDRLQSLQQVKDLGALTDQLRSEIYVVGQSLRAHEENAEGDRLEKLQLQQQLVQDQQNMDALKTRWLKCKRAAVDVEESEKRHDRLEGKLATQKTRLSVLRRRLAAAEKKHDAKGHEITTLQDALRVARKAAKVCTLRLAKATRQHQAAQVTEVALRAEMDETVRKNAALRLSLNDKGIQLASLIRERKTQKTEPQHQREIQELEQQLLHGRQALKGCAETLENLGSKLVGEIRGNLCGNMVSVQSATKADKKYVRDMVEYLVEIQDTLPPTMVRASFDSILQLPDDELYQVMWDMCR